MWPGRCCCVQRDAGELAVGHDLEDDVLVAVAEGGAERVGGVGGGGAVEHDGPVARLDVARDLVPAREGREDDRGARDRELLAAIRVHGSLGVDWQLELASVVPNETEQKI